MNVMRAPHCPDCQKLDNVWKGPFWLNKVLKTIALPEHWFYIALAGFLVFLSWGPISYTFSHDPSMANDRLVYWVMLIGVEVTLATIGAAICGVALSRLPRLMRNILVGYRVMRFADDDGIVHQHIAGDKISTSTGSYLQSRHYGFWRKTFATNGLKIVRERDHWVTIRSDIWPQDMEAAWEMTLDRDVLALLLSKMPYEAGTDLPKLIFIGGDAIELVGSLAARFADQHAAIVSNANHLGRSPHGQAMRKFVTDTTNWLVTSVRRWEPGRIDFISTPKDLFRKSVRRITQAEFEITERKMARKDLRSAVAR